MCQRRARRQIGAQQEFHAAARRVNSSYFLASGFASFALFARVLLKDIRSNRRRVSRQARKARKGQKLEFANPIRFAAAPLRDHLDDAWV